MMAGRAVALLLATLLASAASAAELKIGVVNVDEIVARYRKTEDLKKAEEKKLAERREIQLDKYVLELDVREFSRETSLAENRIRRRITDEISAICARIGEREGYDLILKQSSPGRALRSDRERVEAFELNPVLYAAPSVSLTSRVLEVLDDAYRRGIDVLPDEPAVEENAAPVEGGE